MDPDQKNDVEPASAPLRHRPRGGRAAKREAILRGALSVLAREGFPGASIDLIAREAAVSTRTIYNHFADKRHLFRAVVENSARTVSEVEIDLVQEHLRDGADPERELVAFAREWLTPASDLVEHYALVRQLGADPAQVPDEAVVAWREEGPLRVRQALAEKLAAWADARVLELADPLHAAVHFSLLVSAAVPGPTSGAATWEESELWITSGVRAFLRGHRPR